MEQWPWKNSGILNSLLGKWLTHEANKQGESTLSSAGLDSEAAWGLPALARFGLDPRQGQACRWELPQPQLWVPLASFSHSGRNTYCQLLFIRDWIQLSFILCLSSHPGIETKERASSLKEGSSLWESRPPEQRIASQCGEGLMNLDRELAGHTGRTRICSELASNQYRLNELAVYC